MYVVQCGSARCPSFNHPIDQSINPNTTTTTQEFIYTPLADPLLALVESNKAQSSPATSASLNINLVLGSDYYDAAAEILTADFGFQGYMGVPGLIGTGPESRAAAYANNVSWGKLGGACIAPVCYTLSLTNITAHTPHEPTRTPACHPGRGNPCLLFSAGGPEF